MIAACPLAFGEVGVKERVKSVLNYKKPAFWIVVIAILALIATAVCFLTDPKTEEPEVTAPTGESPYTWTSTLEVWDIRKSWSYQEGQKLLVNTIEGSRLDELVSLFNGITEDEIISRQFSGEDDPFWKFQAASMHLLCEDGTDIRLRYVDDLVIIGADTESGLWETDGYWVIENEAMKRWMRSISLGGTEMLSDENRDEIRRLVRQEYVHFFNPRRYDDLLLVGCCYDGGRGLGVAVYEPLADGYRLLKLIRGDEVKSCASGSEVYYCDYGDLRIFLVLNQSITGMEWAGAYETSYALDTHPGLLVEYFPENLNTMYRFLYGGGNSTMYMDRVNKTHGEPPAYSSDSFADPDDAYSVCANLKLNQVDFVWATEIKTVDTYYEQAFSLELTDEQTVALLNLLRSLPESAFEAVDSPLKELRCLDLFLSNDTGKEGVYPGLRLTLHEEAVYYRFTVDGKTSQSWKIQSPELANYIGSFFGGDTSTWHRFAPVAITEGTVIWSVDKMEITVPQYACFRYEVSAEGIRFKPEGEEDWVLIQYRTEPYVPEELGLRRFREIYGGREVVRGCYGDHDEWNFIDFSFTSGDIAWNFLLLNENAVAWVAEYSRQIAGIIGELNILVKD
jgi:hypothetical protein